MPAAVQFSSYKQYKDGTNAVASYLATTAKSYGYPQDLLCTDKVNATKSQKTPKLKGRARKLARDAVKAVPPSAVPQPESKSKDTPLNKLSYAISPKDFILLADFIASHDKPRVQVPASLLTTIQRTISLRKDHAQSLRLVRLQYEPKSDSSHDYFIGVLQQVYDVLKVRSRPSAVDPALPLHESESNVQNNFDSLTLEEPSQAFLNAPDIIWPPKQEISQELHEEFVVKNSDDVQERYLAAHSTFRDINNLRSFLRKVWFMYRTGHFDLMNCAIVTNTAIDLVRRAQLELVSLGSDFTYEKLAEIFFTVNCLRDGIDPAKREQPDDPINFEGMRHADYTMMLTFSFLESFRGVVQKGSLPMVKPGIFGQYDPKTDRQQKSWREKYHEDRIILMEALPDLCWFTKFGPSVPAEDNLTRMTRLMLSGGTIELWGVFAAQVFIDIHSILRSSAVNGLRDLQNHGQMIRTSLESNFKFHENLKIKNWPKGNDEVLQNMITMLDEFVFHDPVHKIITNLSSSKNLTEVPQFRLMKRHPIYCGLLAFKLNLDMKRFGIDFANAWGSIMYLSHLYNAVEQEKLLDREWPDMELIIDYHEDSQIFIGARPSTLEDYHKKFTLIMGVSVQEFAPERNKAKSSSKIRESSRGPRALENSATPVSELFRKPLDGDSRRADELLVENIREIFRHRPQRYDSVQRHWQRLPKIFNQDPSLGKNFENNDAASLKKFARELTIRDNISSDLKTLNDEGKSHEPKILDSIQLLERLFDALQSELGPLKFDYFDMHRRCWLFLRILNDKLNADFTKFIGPGYLEHENQLPFIIGYILQIGVQSHRVAVQIGLGNDSKSKILLKAAGYLDEYLSTGIGSMEMVKVFQNEARNMRYADLDFLTTDEEVEAARKDETIFPSAVEVTAAVRGTS